MVENKTEIVICLGSSCFARGNKSILPIIQKYLKDNGLEEKVSFNGNHCYSECINGPNVKINGKLYNNINEEKIVQVLNKVFKDNY
ncbi:MAG: (2Fe-2S) ferredoxin domain-containing protein [Bacteroidales bacterium]|nr:(2Fe-2S) ferredoxin domain-containing protein [Bacteroidales bacterium]